MTAAACMENNNNSGTISVKADIFAPGGRGDGGRKAELKPIRRFLIFGRISGEIGIASLARSLTANEGLGRRKST